MEKRQGRGTACWVAGLLLLLVLICGSQDAEAAVRHQVGGTPGWSLPSRSNVNYTNWASTQNFSVGDSLYFNYSKQYHNVLQVTETNYDNCNAASPIATWDDGATVVQLNTTGTFYFICGIPTHCGLGQKVAVSVHAASASTSLIPSASTLLPLLALSLVSVLQLLP